MISIDSSVFIQIANFLILIWVLNKILYRPIREILMKRRDRIAGTQADIEHLIKTSREKDDMYTGGLKAARAQGFKEKEAIITTAEEEEKKAVATISEKAQADLARVKERIGKEAEEIRQSLLQEVDTFATAIGEKILGRSI